MTKKKTAIAIHVAIASAVGTAFKGILGFLSGFSSTPMPENVDDHGADGADDSLYKSRNVCMPGLVRDISCHSASDLANLDN
jgi:hypothetical protein